MTNLDSLVIAIERGWLNESYTSTIDACLKEYSPHAEEMEAKAMFVGLHWKSVPYALLKQDCPNPLLVGSVALRFYLPAFMLASVETGTWNELLERLADGLFRVPKREPALANFQRRFDSLTVEQRHAVLEFMRYSAMFFEPGSRVERRIQGSIASYWGNPK